LLQASLGQPEQPTFASTLFKRFRTIGVSLAKKVMQCNEGTKQISRALLDMPLKSEFDTEDERSESEGDTIATADELVKFFMEQLEQLDILSNETFP